MTIKMIGAICVVISCTGFGYLVSFGMKRECSSLRQLIAALEYILNEVSYRRTPLPELFRLTSSVCSGALCHFFLTVANELEKQKLPDAKQSIGFALKKHTDLSRHTAYCITLLGNTIGTFDLSGQIKAIESVKMEADRLLSVSNRDLMNKSKCYKTLGISAGAALVIIFI